MSTLDGILVATGTLGLLATFALLGSWWAFLLLAGIAAGFALGLWA